VDVALDSGILAKHLKTPEKPSNFKLGHNWVDYELYLHDMLSDVVPHPNALLPATRFQKLAHSQHGLVELLHDGPQLGQSFLG
jgi:hypothetical protein